ncbi:hypothetical protein RIF29_08886 [Crotalaria pallida]|uniref:Uncharacterized protein n=1 Tax=Crotalaria pallida TaxID=3830 RepID=A0AAN9IKG2_CROPI
MKKKPRVSATASTFGARSVKMERMTSKDAQDLCSALRSAYSATPTNLKFNVEKESKSECNCVYFWRSVKMARSTSKDAQDLFRALWSAYSATPTNLKIIDLYVMFAVFTALIQVLY